MLKRNASKKQIKEYKDYAKRRFSNHIRFFRNLETYEQAEALLLQNLRDKYPEDVVEHTYQSYNFHWDEQNQAEILLFYRHPSGKYKDIFLMSMRYNITGVNSIRDFPGGQVSYYLADNELRLKKEKVLS